MHCIGQLLKIFDRQQHLNLPHAYLRKSTMLCDDSYFVLSAESSLLYEHVVLRKIDAASCGDYN
jgi:hypothetical protein